MRPPARSLSRLERLVRWLACRCRPRANDSKRQNRSASAASLAFEQRHLLLHGNASHLSGKRRKHRSISAYRRPQLYPKDGLCHARCLASASSRLSRWTYAFLLAWRRVAGLHPTTTSDGVAGLSLLLAAARPRRVCAGWRRVWCTEAWQAAPTLG